MQKDNFRPDQIYKINMYAILEDVQDQLLTELTPDLRQGMKQIAGRASIQTKQFIKTCDRIFNKENQENFGVTADELRKIIDEIYCKVE